MTTLFIILLLSLHLYFRYKKWVSLMLKKIKKLPIKYQLETICYQKYFLIFLIYRLSVKRHASEFIIDRY